MRAPTVKALTSHARFLEERRRERVSVGSRLLAHASGRKDVEVRVKGGHWRKVTQGKKDYFGGRTGKVTQGKKDYSRLVE